MLDAIGSSTPSFSPYQPATTTPVRTQAAVAQASAQVTRSADIEIVTADGDRVTISSRAVSAASVAAASATFEGPAASGAMAAGAVSTAQSRSFSLTVEGTLEQDEVDDIRRLLSVLERSARHSERGEHGRGHHRGHDAAHHLRRPAFDSLESVSASFSVSRSVQAVVAYQTGSAPVTEPAAPPDTDTASAGAAVIPVPETPSGTVDAEAEAASAPIDSPTAAPPDEVAA